MGSAFIVIFMDGLALLFTVSTLAQVNKVLLFLKGDKQKKKQEKKNNKMEKTAEHSWCLRCG